MHTVIVPLDGSALAERALGLGEGLATALDATLALVCVVDDRPLSELRPVEGIADRVAASAYVAGVAARLAARVSVTTRVAHGDATEELLQLTTDEPDALLVMATHGHGRLGRMWYGSVADAMLRGAAVPVAVVPRDCPYPGTRPTRLLVPLEGSRLADMALRVATDLAAACDATLHLVHVVEPLWQAGSIGVTSEGADRPADQLAEIEDARQTEARSHLSRLAASLRAQGLSVTWEVRHGRPAAELARLAETTEVDLIVLATHGRGGIRRWACGSVTTALLRHGTTPVLAIPPLVRARHDQQSVARRRPLGQPVLDAPGGTP